MGNVLKNCLTNKKQCIIIILSNKEKETKNVSNFRYHCWSCTSRSTWFFTYRRNYRRYLLGVLISLLLETCGGSLPRPDSYQKCHTGDYLKFKVNRGNPVYFILSARGVCARTNAEFSIITYTADFVKRKIEQKLKKSIPKICAFCILTIPNSSIIMSS